MVISLRQDPSEKVVGSNPSAGNIFQLSKTPLMSTGIGLIWKSLLYVRYIEVCLSRVQAADVPEPKKVFFLNFLAQSAKSSSVWQDAKDQQSRDQV